MKTMRGAKIGNLSAVSSASSRRHHYSTAPQLDLAAKKNVWKNVTLLDGGMGHAVRRYGVPIEGPLGSLERFLGVAQANVDCPGIVRDCHMAFIHAGADVITTNSYSLVPSVLGLAGVAPHLRRYLEIACCLADEARQEAGKPETLIAGALPPPASTAAAA